jgi:hypothetical protein
VFHKAANYFGKPCIFKALKWIRFSKVNGPALPKERWIKLLLQKNGSEKKLSTIEPHPHHPQDAQ